MKITLKDLKHYFLTIDTDGYKKHHMFEEFKGYDLTEVNPARNVGNKFKSGPTGFSRMIDIALRNQDKKLPFQPFVMYEDDCSKDGDFPESIEIPDDTDWLYIGLSRSSWDGKIDIYQNFYKIIDDKVVRIYNMLGMHGIIVCSAAGALAIQKGVMEAYYQNYAWDIWVAELQSYYNVYALKTPLVYQDSKYAGHEGHTRFKITSEIDNPLPPEYVNTKNVSVIMSCDSSNPSILPVTPYNKPQPVQSTGQRKPFQLKFIRK
jgi:hypothetical protein